MDEKELISLDSILIEKYKDPEYRKADRQIKPYYDLLLEIIHRRNTLGLSQKELAERSKTHQSRISRIESGEYDLRLSTLIKIAEALETELDIQLVPVYDKDDRDYEEIFNSTTESKFTPSKYHAGNKNTQQIRWEAYATSI